MPCPAQALINIETDKEVKDYTLTHPYTPAGIFHPHNLPELVRCIQQAEGENRSIKAQGSGYSLSRAAVADDYLICTDGLNRWLSQPLPSAETNPNWYRSPEHNRDFLAGIIRPSVRAGLPGDAALVHVEAGIKIKNLLEELDKVGLALPTMGAGGGQSLAGAMSTGTHGSDFLLAPLFDMVRAIHLVGPGGQEWWIEPSSGFAQGGRLAILPGWCPDTKVVRDDTWFRAPIVSVGRCGVIYSVVLEVTRQFKLLDRSEKKVSWSTTRGKLQSSKVVNTRDGVSAKGIFERPSPEPDHSPLRFFQVTVDLAKGEKCWVTRRWKTVKPGQENTTEPTPSSFDAILCGSPAVFGPMLAAVQSLPEVIAMKTTLGLVPIMGPVWVIAIDALFIELISYAAGSATVGEFLAKVAERLNGLTDAEVGAAGELRRLVLFISEMVIDNAHQEERWGRSHLIVDGNPDLRRGCLSAYSAEFFFEASSTEKDYLDFVDEILKISKEGGIPGYASLRFTGKSNCFLAMERYPMTVAIEIAVPRAFGTSGDRFTAFTDAMQAEAKKRGAIPHWGQRHALDATSVETLYAGSLEKWRYVLAELELGHPHSFSTNFSRGRGLEVTDPGIVNRVRTEGDAGALVSSLVPLYLNALPA
jgi:hypothetical protein